MFAGDDSIPSVFCCSERESVLLSRPRCFNARQFSAHAIIPPTSLLRPLIAALFALCVAAASAQEVPPSDVWLLADAVQRSGDARTGVSSGHFAILDKSGAGEVLGEHQSGNMMEIGFQLYSDMLAEAVRALKNGREPDLLAPMQATVEINLHTPALLPSDYCGDVQLRLSFYKKLACAENNHEIDALLEELVDRFGKLPPQAQALMEVHRLRCLGKRYGVLKIDASPAAICISFQPNPPIDGMAIINLIQKNRHIKLASHDKLRIERELPDPAARVHMVRDVLRSLGKPTAAQ